MQIRRVRVAPLPHAWSDLHVLRAFLQIWGQERVTVLRRPRSAGTPEMTFPGSSLPW